MPTISHAVVLGGARTPIGRYGGALSRIRTDDLLAFAMRAAVDRVGVNVDAVEEIAAGVVNVAHEGLGDIARWAALAGGFPDHVPAYTVNRFCASSLTAATNLANSIVVGEFDLALAAGVESMSRSGWAWMKSEDAFAPRGPQFLLDTMGDLRFSKWAYPIAMTLFGLHIAVGQAEPVKYAFKRTGPESICEWNPHYMPLMPLPWCKRQP